MLWCYLFVADLIVRMEELELHCRCRGRSNFRKIRIATMSVRMVPSSQKQLQAKNKIKIPGFWIFSLLSYESESERKSLGFHFIS